MTDKTKTVGAVLCSLATYVVAILVLVDFFGGQWQKVAWCSLVTIVFIGIFIAVAAGIVWVWRKAWGA